jgi:hypothetical protein
MLQWLRRRPNSTAAAKRALVLKFVVAYSMLIPPEAIDKRDVLLQAGEKARKKILSKLGSLRAKLSPWEKQFFQTSPQDIKRQQLLDASWRLESLQILCWGLGFLFDIPPYDQLADREFLKRIPTDETTFLNEARVRPRTVIDKQRDLAELWHWRSRTRQLIERGDALDPALQTAEVHSFDDIVRLAARKAHENGDLLPPLDDDFPVRGTPYRALSAEEWAEVASITRERHFALNWLCGYAPGNRWDETPTHT